MVPQSRLQPLFPTRSPLRELFSFLVYLVKYSFGKSGRLLILVFLAAFFFPSRLAKNLKYNISRKMIWGRGSLSQPISHLAVIGLAAIVFVTGGLLSGSPLIRKTASAQSSDYLPTPDVIPAPIIPETTVGAYSRAEALEYFVRPGDTLSSIGETYHLSIDAIRYANSLTDRDYLKVGQKLQIPPMEGVLHTVKSGDTVSSLAVKYKVSPQTIIEFNYLFEPFALTNGEKVLIPNAEIPAPPVPVYVPGAYAAQSGGSTGPVTGSTGSFAWPVAGHYITQYFHSYHMGIDIGGSSPLYAADGGTVLNAGWNPWGLGYHVKIDHGNGFTSTYGHMSRIDVSVGQSVAKGEVIGQTGNTGNSYGTHLHFIIQKNGAYMNPLAYY